VQRHPDAALLPAGTGPGPLQGRQRPLGPRRRCDAVLVHVAALMQRVRARPGHGGAHGGEEFVVLLPDTRLDEAQHLGERLRELQVAQSPLVHNGHSIAVTVSLGLSDIRPRTPVPKRPCTAPIRPCTKPRPPGAIACTCGLQSAIRKRSARVPMGPDRRSRPLLPREQIHRLPFAMPLVKRATRLNIPFGGPITSHAAPPDTHPLRAAININSRMRPCQPSKRGIRARHLPAHTAS
jgi:hypothetical protein